MNNARAHAHMNIAVDPLPSSEISRVSFYWDDFLPGSAATFIFEVRRNFEEMVMNNLNHIPSSRQRGV